METPESVEDVMVEADGEWHTSDNKFASENWQTSHPLANGIIKSASPQKDPEISAPAPSRSPPSKTTNTRALPEVITLSDSEDDEERIVKRELSPRSGTTSQSLSFVSSRGRSGRSPPPLPPPPLPPKASFSNEVIDLTLDSDDDVPSPKYPQKRKERETDDSMEMSTAWKKPRYSGPSASGSDGYVGYPNGLGTSSSEGGPGLNGKSNSRYGERASLGINGWGPAHLPVSAPPQSAYQVPIPHATPSSTGIPVHPQSINGSYTNYSSVAPRSDSLLSPSAVHPHVTSYYNSHYGHPPPSHTRGEA